MEIFSILLFFIYSLIILGILVYVSPLFSALIMILIPLVLVFILPDEAAGFFSIIQFSYSGIQVFNLHILLLVWSAFIGIISYAEVLTWYLLREPVSIEAEQPQVKEAAQSPDKETAQPEAVPVAGDKPKTLMFKVNDFTHKLYKILKGEKVKLRP
ncbi:MAG: hypothetical protein C3F06_05080 [Candidatus Methanoperedenaceae archaeon]|nr:MAG: hypothetical protein C3F06_05080 [Candidatus Methanoperedenaceae archaeon]